MSPIPTKVISLCETLFDPPWERKLVYFWPMQSRHTINFKIISENNFESPRCCNYSSIVAKKTHEKTLSVSHCVFPRACEAAKSNYEDVDWGHPGHKDCIQKLRTERSETIRL